MTQCNKCPNSAVTFIRYNGTHLCSDHFCEFVRRRVRKELRRQGSMDSGGTLAVALSGGKDSSVLLSLLAETYSNHHNVELSAILVDEGIEGYRSSSIAIARDLCGTLGIPLQIISFKHHFGYTLDEIVERTSATPFGPCAYCGVLRRRCLNSAARESGAAKLAMGHNLDDMAQSILINFARADLKKLARLGPHRAVQPGLVPRLMPLRVIPEKESYLFALLNGLAIHEPECPYAITAHRQLPRDVINLLETRDPGTRHAILRSYDALAEALLERFPMAELGRCETCGEPTSRARCKVCEFVDNINKRG